MNLAHGKLFVVWCGDLLLLYEMEYKNYVFDVNFKFSHSFLFFSVLEMTTTGKTTTLFTATSNSQNLTENSRPQVRETTLVQLSASPSAETTFVVNAKSVYDSSLYETSFSDRSTASTAALPTSQVRQATSAASDITRIPTSVVPTLLSTNAISSSFKSATTQNAGVSSAASLNPIVVQSTLEKTAAASYEQTSISLTRAKIATNFNVNFGTEQNGFRRSIASDFLQKSNEDRIQNIIYIAIGTALGVVVLLLIAIAAMRIWHSKKTSKKSNLEKDQEKAKHGSNTKNYSKYSKATNDAVSNDMSFVSAVKTSSTELESNQKFIFKKTAEKFRPVDIVCD